MHDMDRGVFIERVVLLITTFTIVLDTAHLTCLLKWSGVKMDFVAGPLLFLSVVIGHTWDSIPVTHDPVKITFSPGDGGLMMKASGPFFNDPKAPNGPPGLPFPGLWDYEGEWWTLNPWIVLHRLMWCNMFLFLLSIVLETSVEEVLIMCFQGCLGLCDFKRWKY